MLDGWLAACNKEGVKIVDRIRREEKSIKNTRGLIVRFKEKSRRFSIPRKKKNPEIEN